MIRVTTTTICGTDVHIVKGEYLVRNGLVLGLEPVGVIEFLWTNGSSRAAICAALDRRIQLNARSSDQHSARYVLAGLALGVLAVIVRIFRSQRSSRAMRRAYTLRGPSSSVARGSAQAEPCAGPAPTCLRYAPITCTRAE